MLDAHCLDGCHETHLAGGGLLLPWLTSMLCRWLSLKAWELSEYDAILLLDVRITVMMDISPVFQLPTDFATTLDQQWGRYRCAFWNAQTG